jgi:biopolymer transport protein ExbD
MALFRGHTRGHIVAEINVTPLTDVFLVLLIIFMITTSAMLKPAADVDLPKAAENEDTPKGVLVTMTPTHEIFVNERPVASDDASLASVLRDTLARSPDKVVVLAGDRQVVLGEVVRVLGLAKEAGATGFALASE